MRKKTMTCRDFLRKEVSSQTQELKHLLYISKDQILKVFCNLSVWEAVLQDFCLGCVCLFGTDGAIAGGSIEAWGFTFCCPGKRPKYINTWLEKTKVCQCHTETKSETRYSVIPADRYEGWNGAHIFMLGRWTGWRFLICSIGLVS